MRPPIRLPIALLGVALCLSTLLAQHDDPRIEEFIAKLQFDSLFEYVRELRSGILADPSLSELERSRRLSALGRDLYRDDRILDEQLAPIRALIAEAGEIAAANPTADTLVVDSLIKSAVTALRESGDYEDALRLGRRRIELLEACEDASALQRDLARLSHAKALYDAGAFQEAIDLLWPHLDAVRELLADQPATLADYLNVLGVCLRNRGELQSSAELQLEAYVLLERQRAEKDSDKLRRQWLSQTNNIAAVYIDLDQLRNAELRFREIERYCTENECSAVTRIRYRKGLASIARRQLRFDESEELLRALLDDMHEMSGLPTGEFGLVLDELGWLQRERGESATAISTFGAALDSLRVEAERRSRAIPLVLRRLAETRAAAGELDAAEADLEAALRAQEAASGPDAAEIGIVLASIADLRLERGDPARNIAEPLDRSLALLGRDPLLIGYKADALATRARLRWREGERAAAISDMEQSLREVEYLRAVSAVDPADRARVFSTRLDDYVDLIDWYFELGDQGAAWESYERARARSLLDELRDYRGVQELAEPMPVETPELRAAQARVSTSRRALETAEGADELRIREYEAAFRALQVARARLGASEIDPAAQPGFCSLEELHELLRAQDAMLLAFLENDGIYSLLVARPDRERLEWRRLGRLVPSSASLPGRLGDFGRPFDRAFADDLRQLAEQVIPTDLRDDLRDVSEILVVPAGDLHRIPIEALVLESGDDARSTRFWIDRMPPVRYAPSITTLVQLSRLHADGRGTGEALVIADPTLATNARQWPPLPYARREANSVRQYAPGAQILEGDAATEANFVARAPRSSLLHIATHGVVESRARHEFASLLFASSSENPSRSDDGFLDLDEIALLPLQSELTVLSACNSQSGELVGGEGSFALSRAFLQAGSARVLGTLWPVQDYATAWLMERFYATYLDEEAGSRAPATQVLQRVRHEMRSEEGWEAPCYWAPFVMTGMR